MNVADSSEIGRAYWTQYTAVMLIILTFVIGSFSRATYARELERKAKVIASPQDFGVIEISSAAETVVLSSVAQVLLQHDINAVLTCSGGEASCDALFESTLRRLSELGAPQAGLMTEWVSSSSVASLKLRFVRSG